MSVVKRSPVYRLHRRRLSDGVAVDVWLEGETGIALFPLEAAGREMFMAFTVGPTDAVGFTEIAVDFERDGWRITNNGAGMASDANQAGG